MVTVEGVRYMTVPEAAKCLGVTHGRVRAFLYKDRIPGSRKIGQWLLPIKAVTAFAKIKRKPGHPRKVKP